MKKLLSLTLAICLSSATFALDWQMVGARQMGMGGAGVAIAQGIDAQYYNPALLASVVEEYEVENQFGFTFGATAEISPVLEATRELMRRSNDYKELVSNMTFGHGNEPKIADMKTIFKGMSKIDDLLKSKPSILRADMGFGFKRGSFSVSLRSLSALSLVPKADNVNIFIGPITGFLGFHFSSNTGDPASTYISARDKLKNAIDETGVAANLSAVMGESTTNSTRLANILINTVAEAEGALTPDAIPNLVDKMLEDMSQFADLIKNASTASRTGSYADNKSHVKMDLGSFNEASLGYGLNIGRGIRLGANVKVIEGIIGESGIMVLTDNLGVGSMIHETWNHKKLSTNVGIDVGAAVSLSELFQGNFIFDPTLAITAKNLNSPKFKRPSKPSDYILGDWDDSDFKLKSQFRAGAAIHPFTDRLTIAADIDLNENDTFMEGRKSRQFAGGVEFMLINRHTFKLPIRAGINKNLADYDTPTYFTAGFGTINDDFIFEMAATVGDSTEKLNGNDFPNVIGLSMNFAWKF